jgi:hypothetical protein
MSKLRVQNDDHPEAAGKHLGDAAVLLNASRYDGAGYLSGYVVECALKAVILHDNSFDPHAGSHDTAKLAAWHQKLSKKPFGHDLKNLAAATIGVEGARYLPDLPMNAAVLEWRETLRYMSPGDVTEPRARAYHEWAGMAYEHAIIAMRSDGVI